MSNIYQHFNKEDYQLIDKILELKERVEETYMPVVGVFMTPRQLKVASTLFSKNNDVALYISQLGTERKRVVIAHKEMDKVDFQEVILTIDYPHKFYSLKHHHILGALVHSGVKREMIGDIVTDGQIWQVVVAQTIASFLQHEIQAIGKVKVQLVVSETLIENKQEGTQKDVLLPSLRLDAVISETFRLSRAQAKKYVEQGLILINWEQCAKPEKMIQENDVISVRGSGRLKIMSINGMTQKNKIKATLVIFSNRKK